MIEPVRRARTVPNKMIFALGLAIVPLAAPAYAQPRPGPLVLTAHLLQGEVYWVEGGISNSGFIVGDTGVVVFDAQFNTEAVQKERDVIAEITPKPVNAVVLSHADPDHVGGLPAYPPGITIIAQENTTSIILASIADPTGGPMNGPKYRALASSMPTQTIAETATLVLDGERLELIHTAPAHTSADLALYLPVQKVVFGGDLIVTNLGPFPVVHVGGSSMGWIDSMRAILALDAETYIPGHGPIEGKAMLQDRLHAAEKRREDVKAMVVQGKSLEEVQQALPDKQFDPRFLTYTQVVYQELTKGYPSPAASPWSGLIQK